MTTATTTNRNNTPSEIEKRRAWRLPYGVWHFGDPLLEDDRHGRVIFNRRYEPIFIHYNSGELHPCEPDRYIEDIRKTRFYYIELFGPKRCKDVNHLLSRALYQLQLMADEDGGTYTWTEISRHLPKGRPADKPVRSSAEIMATAPTTMQHYTPDELLYPLTTPEYRKVWKEFDQCMKDGIQRDTWDEHFNVALRDAILVVAGHIQILEMHREDRAVLLGMLAHSVFVQAIHPYPYARKQFGSGACIDFIQDTIRDMHTAIAISQAA